MRELSQFAFVGFVTALGFTPSAAEANLVQTNLVSDISGLALETDSNLKNPWGMAYSAMSPFWVSDQGSGKATLYNALSNPVKQSLVVTIPAGAAPPTGPTGQVFNSTSADFQIPAPGGGTVKAIFLFDTLDGTIQGWNPGSLAGLHTSEPAAPPTPGAVFTGLALGASGGVNYLYAANATGGITVFDGTFANVTSTTFAGKFVDPNPPASFTPFNIQSLNGDLFVTYATATSTGAPLPGGYVDEFDMAGDFIQRIATNGPINAPWGLAIAPSGFAKFGGDLLVGNLYDSRVDAYNLTTDHLDGSFSIDTGFASPVGLWALGFGNGTTGLANTLYFTSGINDQKDGLFGSITSVPEPGTLTLLSFGLAGLLLFGRTAVGRTVR